MFAVFCRLTPETDTSAEQKMTVFSTMACLNGPSKFSPNLPPKKRTGRVTVTKKQDGLPAPSDRVEYDW